MKKDISYCANSEKCNLKNECARVFIPEKTNVEDEEYHTWCCFYVEGQNCEYYYER